MSWADCPCKAVCPSQDTQQHSTLSPMLQNVQEFSWCYYVCHFSGTAFMWCKGSQWAEATKHLTGQRSWDPGFGCEIHFLNMSGCGSAGRGREEMPLRQPIAVLVTYFLLRGAVRMQIHICRSWSYGLFLPWKLVFQGVFAEAISIRQPGRCASKNQ